MQPCLLLALALLGTASASHPGTTEEGRKFRYAVVTKLRTCMGTQRHCREVLGGQLASVHSTARNQELLNLACTYTLWIGAITSRRWEDASPWNYSNCRLFTTCTPLSTHNGLWRSKLCFQLHPFICQ